MIGLFCAVVAITCSLLSSFWCEMVEFHSVSIFGKQSGPNLQFGLWGKRTVDFYVDNSSTNGQATIYAKDKCTKYETNENMDTKWKTARAFSIISPVLGVLSTGAGLVTSDSNHIRMIGIFLMVFVTLFQGLTLLVFRSNLCERLPLLDESPLYYALLVLLYPNSCVMAGGTIANIVSIIFWFLTGVTMIVFGSSSDWWYRFLIGSGRQQHVIRVIVFGMSVTYWLKSTRWGKHVLSIENHEWDLSNRKMNANICLPSKCFFLWKIAETYTRYIGR